MRYNKTINLSMKKGWIKGDKISYIILPILFLALCIRIYAAFFSGISWHTIDTGAYYTLADSFQESKYIEPYMPPGYPFLIVLLDRFGNRDLTMIIFNIIASLLACLFVYFICLKITKSTKAAFLAALILAFYPGNIHYVSRLLTETPAMFFLTASVFFFLCFNDSFINCFFSGLALGVASIIRLTCLPMIFFPLLAYLLQKKYKKLILYLISFTLPVIFTLGLNYYHTKRLFICNNAVPNFIISAELRSNNIFFDTAKEQRYQKLIIDKDSWNAAMLYLKEIKHNPKEWIIKRIISAWELWGPYPADDGRRSTLIRIIIGLRFILLILSVVGGYFLLRRNREQLLILAGPIISITLVHVLSCSVPRYTHVVEPLAICLALCAFFGRE